MSVSDLWQHTYMQELQRLSANDKLTPTQRVDAASCVADLSIEAYRARLEKQSLRDDSALVSAP